jgi:hypothetical protein
LSYPAQSIRFAGAEFYRFGCGFVAVVLTIQAGYLGIEAGWRNEPRTN